MRVEYPEPMGTSWVCMRQGRLVVNEVVFENALETEINNRLGHIIAKLTQEPSSKTVYFLHVIFKESLPHQS